MSSPALLDSLTCFDYDDDGYTADDGDCDDTESTTYPGAPEICLDYVDNDCDGNGTIHLMKMVMVFR